MAEFLPSVSVALWAAAAKVVAPVDPLDAELRALTGAGPAPQHPLQVWRETGERHVLVALPAPGRLGMLPRGDAGFRAAALEAGECVFSPTFGGALVPRLVGDPDAAPDWEPWDTEPLDVRRVQARDAGEARQELNVAIDVCVQRLQTVDQSALADVGDALMEQHRGPALPEGVPPRLASLIVLADRVLAVAELRHDPRIGAMSAHGTVQRELALADLAAAARSALETATNAAVLALADQR